MHVTTTTSMLFEKRTVAELSEAQLMTIDGGSSHYCAGAAALFLAVEIAQAGYAFGNWLAGD
jgi:lactobin A/cerein 7B family class IIb bacteriocin